MKRHIALLFLLLMVEVFGCKEENQIQTIQESSSTVNAKGMGYVQLWINNEGSSKKDPYFTLEGRKVSSIIVTIDRICALLKETNDDQCIPLDISGLADARPDIDGLQYDLLDLTDNEPVLFSKLAIPLGTYVEIQIHIADEENFIVFDQGEATEVVESFELTVPDPVIRLFGEFELKAEGDLFNLYFDLVASEMIFFISGEGYVFRPIILLSKPPLENGYYKGTLDGSIVVASMDFKNSTFHLKSSADSRIETKGVFSYNTSNKVIALHVTHATCEGCGLFGFDIERDQDRWLRFGINEWTNSRISFRGFYNGDGIFTRIDHFDLNPEDIPLPTHLTVTLLGMDPLAHGNVAVGLFEDVKILTTSIPLIDQGDVADPLVLEFDIPDLQFGSREGIRGYLNVFTYNSVPNPVLLFSDDNKRFGLNPDGMIDRKRLTVSAMRGIDNQRVIIYESLMRLQGNPMDTSMPMTLSWNSVYGANQYVIIVSKGSSSKPPEIFKEIIETSYTFTNEEYLLYKQWFEEGKRVYFAVTAVDEDYVGLWDFMDYQIFFGRVNKQVLVLIPQ